MGRLVKIRALVSEAGPDRAWTAGTVIEVDEDEASARINDGRAEPIDPPADRAVVNRAGQPVATAAVVPRERRQTIIDFGGLADDVKTALVAAGFATLDDLDAASDAELQKVPGVGPATVKRIRAALNERGNHG